jgi:hypothetical protein
MRRQVLGPRHADVAISLVELSRALVDQGRNLEAEPLSREALDIRKAVFGENHRETATSKSDLGQILQRRGDLAGAEILLRETLATAMKVLGPDHPNTGASMGNLAGLLMAKDHFVAAEVARRPGGRSPVLASSTRKRRCAEHRGLTVELQDGSPKPRGCSASARESARPALCRPSQGGLRRHPARADQARRCGRCRGPLGTCCASAPSACADDGVGRRRGRAAALVARGDLAGPSLDARADRVRNRPRRPGARGRRNRPPVAPTARRAGRSRPSWRADPAPRAAETGKSSPASSFAAVLDLHMTGCCPRGAPPGLAGAAGGEQSMVRRVASFTNRWVAVLCRDARAPCPRPRRSLGTLRAAFPRRHAVLRTPGTQNFICLATGSGLTGASWTVATLFVRLFSAGSG